MATESSAIIRFIDQVQRQPIFEAPAFEPEPLPVVEPTVVVRMRDLRRKRSRGWLVLLALLAVGIAAAYWFGLSRTQTQTAASVTPAVGDMATEPALVPEPDPIPEAKPLIVETPDSEVSSDEPSAVQAGSKVEAVAESTDAQDAEEGSTDAEVMVVVEVTADRALATDPAAKTTERKRTPRSQTGTLMLGSKPPCDIIIDGKKTGKKTPQRSLQLKAGKHRVTLVNDEFGIRKSFSVRVRGGGTTRVIKDLLD
jgi:hypothetical protein